MSNDNFDAAGPEEPDKSPDANADPPEFEAFLTQIGYGHLFREHIDPPREDDFPLRDLPEAAPSIEGAASRPLPSPRKSTPLRSGAKMLLALAVLSLASAATWYALQRFVFKAPEINYSGDMDLYVGSPFFSMERFDALRPGTTREALLDTLGLPVSRRTRLNDKSHEDWYYGARSKGNSNVLLVCLVTLDAGKVLRTKKFAVPDATAFGTPWPGNCLWKTGSIQVKAEDGNLVTLDASDPEPCILLCATGGGIEKEVAGLPARAIVVKFPPPPQPRRFETPAGAIYIRRAGGRLAVSENAQPRSEPISLHGVTVVRMNDLLPLEVSPVCVFWKGTLYCVPLHVEGLDVDTLKADIHWLLRRLASSHPAP